MRYLKKEPITFLPGKFDMAKPHQPKRFCDTCNGENCHDCTMINMRPTGWEAKDE